MSSTPYEQVLSILHDSRGWAADEAPAPEAVAEYLAANPDATPESIAEQLEAHLDDVSHGKPRPYDYAGTARDYERDKRFTAGVEYWLLNTRLALGLTSEAPVFHGRVARDVDEWWANLAEGLSYLGYPLLDQTPEGLDELAQRRAAMAKPPRPFAMAGLGETAQLLIGEGLLKPYVDPGLGKPAEYLGGDVRRFAGMCAQKVLDNLHAARRTGRVRAKWLEGGTLNPDWNPAWDR